MPSLVSIAYFAQPTDTPQLRRDLEDALLVTVESMLRDYAATTATWETPVEFDFEVAVDGDSFEAIVGTDNEIYEWVNNGTGQAAGNRGDWYPIRPVNAEAIAYQSRFSPKTQPGVLRSQGGGKRGPVDVIRPEVFHPGIEPRNFDETITKKWQPLFEKRFDRTLAAFYLKQERLQQFKRTSRR